MVEISAHDNPAEKQTMWIGDESKDAFKIIQVLPSMGNARITIMKKS
jgi:hypothetical protein